MRPDLRDASYLWDIVDAGRTAIEATRHLDLAAYERDRVVQLEELFENWHRARRGEPQRPIAPLS